MTEKEARRVHRECTSEEQKRLKNYRNQIDQELPEILQRAEKRENALQESTLSGQLRRAVTESELNYTEIAAKSQISIQDLDEFMTGERELSSGTIDKIALTLGYQLQSVDESTI